VTRDPRSLTISLPEAQSAFYRFAQSAQNCCEPNKTLAHDWPLAVDHARQLSHFVGYLS